MKSSNAFAVSALCSVLLVGCASSTPSVDLREPKRVLGTDNNVRVDAQLLSDQFGPTSSLVIKYQIENLRDTPIAVAEVSPEASYDEATRTITVQLGAEIPGRKSLPKLVPIAAGEKKSFSGSARMNVYLPRTAIGLPYPRFVQVKVNFLGDRAVIDSFSKASVSTDDVFTRWVENNQALFTNAVPISWSGQDIALAEATSLSRGGGM